jgi:hypothetical protein
LGFLYGLRQPALDQQNVEPLGGMFRFRHG